MDNNQNPSPAENQSPLIPDSKPLSELESPSSTPEAEAPVVEEDAEFDFDAIAGELDKGEEPPAEFDKESPAFAKLAEDFKAAMGVDLKDAMETFTETKRQLDEMRQELNAQRSRDTLNSLQDAWDVTPKEMDRRVDLVLKTFKKMTPKQVERYDSLQGIQDMWAKIDGSKSKSAPSSGGQKTATPTKRYKQSEIRDMMMNNPKLYDQSAAALSEAFRLGLVDSD